MKVISKFLSNFILIIMVMEHALLPRKIAEQHKMIVNATLIKSADQTVNVEQILTDVLLIVVTI